MRVVAWPCGVGSWVGRLAAVVLLCAGGPVGCWRRPMCAAVRWWRDGGRRLLCYVSRSVGRGGGGGDRTRTARKNRQVSTRVSSSGTLRVQLALAPQSAAVGERGRHGGREQRAAWSRAQWQSGQEKAQVEGLKKCCVAAVAVMVSVAVAGHMGGGGGTGPSGVLPCLTASGPAPRRCRWRFRGLAPRRRAVSQPCSALAGRAERERPIAFLFCLLLFNGEAFLRRQRLSVT